MNSRPTKEHLDKFVAHTIAALPDSLHLRKTVLITLLAVLPREYPRRSEIKLLLANLHAHEADQLKFRELL